MLAKKQFDKIIIVSGILTVLLTYIISACAYKGSLLLSGNSQDIKLMHSTLLGIPINAIMNMYFVFFIISLLPMLFLVTCKILGDIQERREKKIIVAMHPELVTIIVPAYNEEKSIARCIEALLNQDYKGKLEIIVANDGSTDKTPEIIPLYPVIFLDIKQNGGKANALNEGVKIANGDVVIFSDGDSNMEKSAVRHIIDTLMQHPDVDLVTGNVLVNMPENANMCVKLFTYFQMIEYYLEQNVARAVQAISGGVLVCPGPITAARREVCDVVKFSDSTIVEDADFTIDSLILKMKIIRCDEAKVYTNAPTTLKSWIKQRDRWWFGNLQVWEQHKIWAIRNVWMVYNYWGFVLSVITICLIVLIPVLVMQYSDPMAMGALLLKYMSLPIVIYAVFNAIFFMHDKKLALLMIPYIALYGTLRVCISCKLYLAYITGVGMKVKFGARVINTKLKAKDIDNLTCK